MNRQSFLSGALGFVVTAALLFLAYTAYQDHKALWEVVTFINTKVVPTLPQSAAPTPEAKK